MLKLLHNCAHFTCQQGNAQNPSNQASEVHELSISICRSWIQKRQRNQASNYQYSLDHKAREFHKKASTSASLSTLKPVTVWITTNCGKFLRRQEYQTTLAVSRETYLHIRKQQLELDIEQQTGSKLGKEYVEAIYCHPAYSYLTYMQSTSCKLEFRLPGEISTTSDMQMIPL